MSDDAITTDFKARISEEVKSHALRIDRLERRQDRVEELLQTILTVQERTNSDLNNHMEHSEQHLEQVLDIVKREFAAQFAHHEVREERKMAGLLTKVLGVVFSLLVSLGAAVVWFVVKEVFP